MSEFNSTAREAQLTGQRMDEVRSEEWAEKRADSESLRSSLERDTESLDDPPEKISLDDAPFDKHRRHGDIRSDLAAAVDQSFYNSSQAEKREREQAKIDLWGRHTQRKYGYGAAEATKRIQAGLEALETQPVEALQFLYNEYVVNGAGQAAHAKENDSLVKHIEAVEKKYDVPSQVWDLVPDYMGTPGFQRRKTGDPEADLMMAVRDVKRGMDRVKMR